MCLVRRRLHGIEREVLPRRGLDPREGIIEGTVLDITTPPFWIQLILSGTNPYVFDAALGRPGERAFVERKAVMHGTQGFPNGDGCSLRVRFPLGGDSVVSDYPLGDQPCSIGLAAAIDHFRNRRVGDGPLELLALQVQIRTTPQWGPLQILSVSRRTQSEREATKFVTPDGLDRPFPSKFADDTRYAGCPLLVRQPPSVNRSIRWYAALPGTVSHTAGLGRATCSWILSNPMDVGEAKSSATEGRVSRSSNSAGVGLACGHGEALTPESVVPSRPGPRQRRSCQRGTRLLRERIARREGVQDDERHDPASAA